MGKNWSFPWVEEVAGDRFVKWIFVSLWSCAKSAIRRWKKECSLDAVSAADLGVVGDLAVFVFFLFVALREHSMGKRQASMEG